MKSKPVFYKYPMRSTLEGRWARFFDNMGIKWRYETDIYHSYKPDFVLEYEDGLVYVEVKGEKDPDLSKVESFANEHSLMLLLGPFPHDIGDYITGFMNDTRSMSNYYWKDSDEPIKLLIFMDDKQICSGSPDDANSFFGKNKDARDRLNAAFKEASEYTFDENNCRLPYSFESIQEEIVEEQEEQEQPEPAKKKMLEDVYARQTYWIRKEYIGRIKDYACTERLNVRQAVDRILEDAFARIDEDYARSGVEMLDHNNYSKWR